MTCLKHPTSVISLTIALLLSLPSSIRTEDLRAMKPFTQWDEKEARKLLGKSAWGKTRLITEGAGYGEGGGVRRSDPLIEQQMESARRSRTRRSTGNNSPSGGPADRIGSAGRARAYDLDVESTVRAESYQVFWYSSLRARHAIGRLRQLRGLNLEQELGSLESQCQKDYVIAISGPVVRFFRHAELEELRPKTFLVSKKDKHKKISLREYVPPEVLHFPMALFLFSREADGKPMLELKDDEACFLTEQGPVRVKVSFKLKEMITDGKLDL